MWLTKALQGKNATNHLLTQDFKINIIVVFKWNVKFMYWEIWLFVIPHITNKIM